MERETIRSSVRVVTVEGKKIVLCTGASSELTTNRNGCSEMRQGNGDATVIRKRDIARSELRVRRIETEPRRIFQGPNFLLSLYFHKISSVSK